MLVGGLTALALAYVMEGGLPGQFYHIPIDTLEAAQYDFPHIYQHLSCDCGSHLFVPMELRLAKFFRGIRGNTKS